MLIIKTTNQKQIIFPVHLAMPLSHFSRFDYFVAVQVTLNSQRFPPAAHRDTATAMMEMENKVEWIKSDFQLISNLFAKGRYIMGISLMHCKPQNDSEMYERVMDTGDLWKLDCEALNYVCPYLCDPNLYRFANNSTPAPQNGSVPVSLSNRKLQINSFRFSAFHPPFRSSNERWAFCAQCFIDSVAYPKASSRNMNNTAFTSTRPLCLPDCLMPFVQVKMSKTLNDHFMHSTPSLKSEKRMELWNITNH